jgi:hypothetical protein
MSLRYRVGIQLEQYKPIEQFSVLVENGERQELSCQVLLFREGQEVPEDIAQWLSFRSKTDELIMTETADDRYRFGETSEIQRRLLKDQGGRRLYCLVDEESRALSGAIWIHPLEGGETGAALVKACEVFNNWVEYPSDHINPAKMATLASSMYSDIRHHKAHSILTSQLRGILRSVARLRGCSHQNK